MFFEKVKRNAGFDCYAFLVDYENMGLDWPDGYETTQLNGQAPIAVNDNYLFFAQNDTIHMLDFGSFKEQKSPLPPGTGAAFNKNLEAVALQNEEKENSFPQLENLICAMEAFTRAKHGDNDLDDMRVIMLAGMLESLLTKLSQSNQNYSMELDPNPDSNTPARDGLCKMLMHIHTNGQKITLEQALDDIDGEAFRPTLQKMQLANIDLYAVWADWRKMPPQVRPTGFEGKDRCPVGINNNDLIFCINGMIYQVNVLNGKTEKIPFDNVMPKLEQAANQTALYFKEHNIEIENFLGNLMQFAADDGRSPIKAASIYDDMRNIWNFAYRITTEHVAMGRGQFVSTRNNRSVTLEEMIEVL